MTIQERNNEHPDDRALREKAEAQAALIIDGFLNTHQKELKDLIATYADRKAELKLIALREEFWSQI